MGSDSSKSSTKISPSIWRTSKPTRVGWWSFVTRCEESRPVLQRDGPARDPAGTDDQRTVDDSPTWRPTVMTPRPSVALALAALLVVPALAHAGAPCPGSLVKMSGGGAATYTIASLDTSLNVGGAFHVDYDLV